MSGRSRLALEAFFRRYWSGEGGGSSLLLTAATAPLSTVYGGGIRLRNLAFGAGLFRVRKAPVPAISVGNLAVGGTGKTPVARWVLDHLLEVGRRPALVTRGYGEDEILLHRRWHPEVPVVADRDRLRGAHRAAEEGADVVVLDDGFQHRRVHRDLDLVLLSPGQPFPPRLLPRGPYREPLRALRRAHLLLVTPKGRTERAPGEALRSVLARIPGFPPAEVLPLGSGPWEDLGGAPAPAPVGPVLLVTSVARPESVRSLAAETGVEAADHLAYRDHQPYGRQEVEEITRRAGSRTIVTTEKDAVKLLPFADALPPIRVLPLRVEAGEAVRQVLNDALNSALRKGRGK